ncbi:MAG: FeoB-associated Cys-rich membrane protein [Oscillospiraceae bacterium]
MGVADWIAIALIAFAVFCAVYFMIKNKKCGKGCSGCPYSGECSRKSEKEER